MNFLVITQKLRAEKGNAVCVTKIKGVNNERIQPGNQFAGELERDVEVGDCIVVKSVQGSRGIHTSEINSIVVSFNSMLIWVLVVCSGSTVLTCWFASTRWMR